jgi:NAD(P)-dependent dehydrogenase (short-subunit alcohol dehydrogenase family)/acyl carrier protein
MLRDDALAEETFSWLIFLDECGIGTELAHRLNAAGHRVTMVKTGDNFRSNSQFDYFINPKEKEDYQELLQTLRREDQLPDKILHLWCLTPEPDDLSDRDGFQLGCDLGFNSLLFLAQAIGNQFFSHSLEIKIISNHLYEVTGDEYLIPEKALLLGPCRVIPHEYPNVRCASIDLVLPRRRTSQEESLLNLLLKELTTQTDDSIVAYRGRHRWIQFFEPLSSAGLSERSSRIKAGGVYFITGGLGGIGLTLAEQLAQSVQAKLVLVSRTHLPPKDEWPQWLETHHERDAVRDKIMKILAIEKIGAEVLIVGADVTDPIQMKAAVELALDRFKQIDGVIHAAGIAGGGIMQLKTAEVVTEIFAPKIKGLQVMVDCFKGIQLDFLVLCSALSALFGEAGQVDYCAANAALDAYARKYHKEFNVVSINWGTWREVGMAVNTEVPSDLRAVRERNISLGIAPAEGKKAFHHVLKFNLPQVVVSPPELFSRFETGTLVAEPDRTFEASVEPDRQAAHSRPDLSSVYVVPGNSAETAIAEIWQELLKIDKVGVHDNFFDLGGHSLLATRLIARLRSAFPVEFTMADLFERPTVHSLSELVLEQEKGPAALAESKDRGQRRKEKRLQRINPKRNRISREQLEGI